jgi:hypothetical protein
MSVIFNLVILVLWRFNIGNLYTDDVAKIPKDGSLPSTPGVEIPYQGVLRVTSEDMDAAASIVEEVLQSDVKRWEPLASKIDTGVLDYLVRFKKKKNPPAEVLTTLTQRGVDIDLKAEFIPLGD